MDSGLWRSTCFPIVIKPNLVISPCLFSSIIVFYGPNSNHRLLHKSSGIDLEELLQNDFLQVHNMGVKELPITGHTGLWHPPVDIAYSANYFPYQLGTKRENDYVSKRLTRTICHGHWKLTKRFSRREVAQSCYSS